MAALPLLERALDILVAVKGPGDPETSQCLIHLMEVRNIRSNAAAQTPEELDRLLDKSQMAQLKADLLAAEADRRDAESVRMKKERERLEAEELRAENMMHKEVMFAGWERHEGEVVEMQKTRLEELKAVAEEASSSAKDQAEEYAKIMAQHERMDAVDAAEMSLLQASHPHTNSDPDSNPNSDL